MCAPAFNRVSCLRIARKHITNYDSLYYQKVNKM